MLPDISVSGKDSIFMTMIQDEQKLSCSEAIAANPPADNFMWTRYDLLQSEASENFTLTPLPSGTTEQINCLASNTFSGTTTKVFLAFLVKKVMFKNYFAMNFLYIIYYIYNIYNII